MQLFKLLLLEKKILFYGKKVEQLSLHQYCLASLVPGLMKNLKFMCGTSPLTEETSSPEFLDEKGFPLYIFHEHTFFQPYLPLQQLGMLNDCASSYMVGTSNSVIVQNANLGADVIANVGSIIYGHSSSLL
ncbi:AVL9/DENND6 domain-containing protein [Chytridium lagenaria]|nr:AVL9/DENND6 domain-containing protein [Chytridium lagenaria]